jgi:hypothetical protein
MALGLWRRAAQEAYFWTVAEEVRRIGGQIYVGYERAEWASAFPKRWSEERSDLLWVRKVAVKLHSNVSSEQFRSILDLASLSSLTIADTDSVGDNEMGLVAARTTLEYLLLENVPVGDQGLRLLKALPRLHYLRLANTQATPAGVVQLLGNPKLARIDVESKAGDFITPLWLRTSPPKKPGARDNGVTPFDLSAAVRVNADGIPLPPTLELVVRWRRLENERNSPWFAGQGTAKLVRPGEYELLDGWGGKQGEWTGKHRVFMEVEIPVGGTKIRYSAMMGVGDVEPGKAFEMRPGK